MLLLAQCDKIGKTEFPTPQPTSNIQLDFSSLSEIISGNSVNNQHLFLKNLKVKYLIQYAIIKLTQLYSVTDYAD